jgi:hypothetical protein
MMLVVFPAILIILISIVIIIIIAKATQFVSLILLFFGFFVFPLQRFAAGCYYHLATQVHFNDAANSSAIILFVAMKKRKRKMKMKMKKIAKFCHYYC